MKITAERDALAAALDRVAPYVVKKPTIPVTGCLLLYGGNGRLSLTANDLDNSSEISIPAEIERSGAVALPAETLRGVVKGAAQGAQVLIDAGADGHAVVRVARSRYKVPTLPAGDFPDFIGSADSAESISFELGATEAARLFRRPLPLTKPDAATPYFEGVWLHLHEGRLWSIGGGRYYMGAFDVVAPAHVSAFSFETRNTERQGIVIPKSAAEGLASTLSAGGTLSTNGRVVVAQSEHARFAGRLLVNDYPDMWRVVRPPAVARITLERDDLQRALKRLDLVTGEHSALDLSADAGAGALRLSIADATKGEGAEEVRIADGEGPLSARLNPKHLSTMLAAMTGEEVAMSRPEGHNLLRLEDTSDASTVMMLAPAENNRVAPATGTGGENGE